MLPKLIKRSILKNWIGFELRQEALKNKARPSNEPSAFSIVFRESYYPDSKLNLKISIAGKTYKMHDNNFIIKDLPAGEYSYQLVGEIGGYKKSIDILGEGKLKIIPNSVYYCIWNSKNEGTKDQYYQAWLRPY